MAELALFNQLLLQSARAGVPAQRLIARSSWQGIHGIQGVLADNPTSSTLHGSCRRILRLVVKTGYMNQATHWKQVAVPCERLMQSWAVYGWVAQRSKDCQPIVGRCQHGVVWDSELSR